jgi:hypothetical protein
MLIEKNKISILSKPLIEKDLNPLEFIANCGDCGD